MKSPAASGAEDVCQGVGSEMGEGGRQEAERQGRGPQKAVLKFDALCTSNFTMESDSGTVILGVKQLSPCSRTDLLVAKASAAAIQMQKASTDKWPHGRWSVMKQTLWMLSGQRPSYQRVRIAGAKRQAEGAAGGDYT